MDLVLDRLGLQTDFSLLRMLVASERRDELAVNGDRVA
jgi:hypothetical protein